MKDPARRAELEKDDAAWLRFYLPDVFFNPFTDDHLETISDVGTVLNYGTLKCTAAERGDGKSSIVKYLMTKYCLQRRLMFPIVIAATNGKAKKTSESVKSRLASRQLGEDELAAAGARGVDTTGLKPNFLFDDYPLECSVARWVDPWPSRARNVTANGLRRINVEWGSADGYFVMPTWADECPIGPIFMSQGWESEELQGCNVYDRRPDAIMLDDLDSRSSLATEQGVVAGKIEIAIETTIAGLAGPGRDMGQYFLCTIPSELAVAAKYSDPERKPAWNGIRRAAIKKWPERMDLWNTYILMWQKDIAGGDPFARDACQFYLDNRDDMDAGAEVGNPYRYSSTVLPDGTQKEYSCLQRCFNYIAKHGRESFETEHQNNPPPLDTSFETKLTPYHIASQAGEYGQGLVGEDVSFVTRGIDVRKIELHQVAIAEEPSGLRIPDYSLKTHGDSETTVEMAEERIEEALHRMADQFEKDPLIDVHGQAHVAELTLIDKGWVGHWTEDGVIKTWVGQPVDAFCVSRGTDLWLPAKGHGTYVAPTPSRKVIIGDRWHINKKTGTLKCPELIWDTTHWRMLVEETFTREGGFELFSGGDGIYSNHSAFANHILAGVREMKEEQQRGTRTKKPKFKRDHWWDALAMSLVARSVVLYKREKAATRKPAKSLSEMRANA